MRILFLPEDFSPESESPVSPTGKHALNRVHRGPVDVRSTATTGWQ